MIEKVTLGGTRPRRSLGINSAVVLSVRLQEIGLHPVHAEAAARLPHPGEGPDPAAAAAALPDLRGGVAEERLSGERLLSRNHAAVPKNGEAESPLRGAGRADFPHCVSKFSLMDKQNFRTAAVEREMENKGAVRRPDKQSVKTAAEMETMLLQKHSLNNVHKQRLW